MKGRLSQFIVNCYAVQDRIDLTCSVNTVSSSAHTEVSVESLLPTDDDRKHIMANFIVLAGRILSDLIPEFRDIPNLATQHIPHSHSKEMNTKSKIVCKCLLA